MVVEPSQDPRIQGLRLDWRRGRRPTVAALSGRAVFAGIREQLEAYGPELLRGQPNPWQRVLT